MREEVVVPQELPKPLEEKKKLRAEDATTGILPKKGIELRLQQWDSGPVDHRMTGGEW